MSDDKNHSAIEDIHSERTPCPTCKGEGTLLQVDPLDLKRWREGNDVPLASFRRGLVNPNTSKPPSIGFLHAVEHVEPATGKPKRKCPPWLFAEYLSIPNRTWDGSLRGAHLRGKKLVEMSREARKAETETIAQSFLASLAPNEHLSISDFALRMDVGYPTARRYVKRLVEEGHLVKSTSEATGWSVYGHARPEKARRA